MMRNLRRCEKEVFGFHIISNQFEFISFRSFLEAFLCKLDPNLKRYGFNETNLLGRAKNLKTVEKLCFLRAQKIN
jgi:hypothetical protein